MYLRLHYTTYNPIDDHSSVSVKTKVREEAFQTTGPVYQHAVQYLPFINSLRNHTVTHYFSDLQDVYSGKQSYSHKMPLVIFTPTPDIVANVMGIIIIQAIKAVNA